MAEITQTIATTAPSPRRKPIKWSVVTDHAILIIGALLMILPIAISLTTASLSDISIEREGLQFAVGDQFDDNVNDALFRLDFA